VCTNITTTGETTTAKRAHGIEECTTMTCSIKYNTNKHSEKPSIRVYIGQCLIRVYKGHTIYQQHAYSTAVLYFIGLTTTSSTHRQNEIETTFYYIAPENIVWHPLMFRVFGTRSYVLDRDWLCQHLIQLT